MGEVHPGKGYWTAAWHKVYGTEMPAIPSVMVNLSWLFNYIWSPLKPQHLDTRIRGFFIRSSEVGRPTIHLATSSGNRLQKRTWKKEILLFACLPSLALASSSVILLRHSCAGVRTYFFRISV